VLLDSSETGFLYQAGGTGRGLVLYVWDGKIYAQAGDGSTSGGDIEISYTIPASITTSDVTMIVYSVNITTGSSANLYVNGQLVATASGTTNVDVSGNSEGGSGTSYGATPVTRVTSGSETYTGTIYETLTWKNVFV
jgi:hypothetical protein